jgi:inorganic pyrophosphatase
MSATSKAIGALNEALADIEAKTIERCALIAERYRDCEKVVQHRQWTFTYRAADEIAKAIRELAPNISI